MTIHRNLNKFGRGGNHATWWLVKTMVDAGWTVPMSGSGTGGLYSAGNVFNMAQLPKQHSLLGANGVGVGSEPWGYGSCWMVLEDPSGNRQVLIQRDSANSDSTDDDWYIGYSFGGRYGEGQTAGVDWDEITIPEAPDRRNLFASPGSWANIFPAGGDPTLTHVAADDTPSPSGEYGVCFISFVPVEGAQPRSFIIFDDVRQAPVGHPHPYILFVSNFADALNIGNIGGTATPRYGVTVEDPGGPGQRTTNMLASHLRYQATSIIPKYGGLQQDNKERAMPLFWGFSGNECYVGLSRWLLWAAQARDYPVTAGAKTLIYCNDCVIRDLWDGVSIPETM